MLVAAALGVVLSWAASLLLCMTVDPRRGVASSSVRWTAPGTLTSTQMFESTFSVYIEQELEPEARRPWGTEQITGPPDTHGEGDIQTAWASATPDGQDEWVRATWNTPVTVSSISVYQTYNPGAISAVAVSSDGGHDQVIWRAPAPDPAIDPATLPARARGPVVLSVPLSPPRTIDSVLLTIDSSRMPGWNEIDAVGVRDSSGAMQYADGAQASSCYADRTTEGGASLNLPRWSGMREQASRDDARGMPAEQRMAGAFGWPLPAWAASRRQAISGARPTGPGMPGVPGGMGGMVGAAAGAPAMRAVPYWPVWPGVVVNSALGASVLLVLYGVLVYPLRPVRRLMRMQRGCCPGCGYDVRYQFSTGCPECGLLRTRNLP